MITERVEIHGVRADGTTVKVGTAPMPVSMKAREIARAQFGHFEDDDGSDAELCFGALEELANWMGRQGWIGPHVIADLLPGTYYMDEPDGGAPTLLEQLQRMAQDAARWRTVAAAAMGVDPKLAALMAKQADGRA